MSEAPAIGIDLGTTYSSVSVFQDGKVTIITNSRGNQMTPSCVAFTDKEVLFGEAAVEQSLSNLSNTMFNTKRLIGLSHSADMTVLKNSHCWPFTVKNDRGRLKIEVSYKGERKLFLPEEISSMILWKMKRTAELYLGKTVTDAVITVPACFSIAQRQAIIDAAAIAGLNVLGLLNETRAAAIVYSLEQREIMVKDPAMIVHIGGGTVDISIVHNHDGIYKIASTAGDNYLGGEDFTDRMMDYIIEEAYMSYCEKFRVRSPVNQKILRRLRNACERAKKILSSSIQARIELDSLWPGFDFKVEITREKFEELCEDLFIRISELAKKAIAKSEKSLSLYHTSYILIGGSTRIPKIRELLFSNIRKGRIIESSQPNEIVACGAAIQATILHGDKLEILEGISVPDVITLPLGTEIAGGVMLTVIAANTRIPLTETKMYTTFSDNQPDAVISVYDGERAMTMDNHFAGKFELSGIPPAPRGVLKIEIAFHIDDNGILKVSASEKSNGEGFKINVKSEQRLSEEDIKFMAADAKRYCYEDEGRERTIATKRSAANRTNMKNTIHDAKIKDKIDSFDE